MNLIIHIDGGSRGNPGPAGAGVVVQDPDAGPVFEAGYFLGEMTNNAAEYHGLLKALEVVAAWPESPVTIRSDSELLVRQITGEYRVKSSQLAGLYEQAQKRLLRRDHWQIRHVPREENSRADELANRAMDAEADVIVVDRRPSESSEGGGGTRSRGGATGERDSAGNGKHSPGRKGRGGASAAAAESALGQAARRVEARCVSGCSSKVCPVPCEEEDIFFFSSCGPQNLCLDGLAAMLHTVLALRDAPIAPNQSIPPLTIRCARTGCGGAFELRLSDPE